ncbi:MAG: GNAT family N-acetyltransferase [Candidatus Omnitrophica bacterium]|nr:GNAT family N-acetyltransferase [Candidatus Omnitrophota bacterium]
MTMRTVAIIQARMQSRRLPGKVLMPIAGKPLLQFLVERLRQARSLDGIVVATGDVPANRPILELASTLGVPSVVGSEDDVLGRYLKAARQVRAEVIVRVTADNALTDPEVLDMLVKERAAHGADLAVACDLIDGAGSEVTTLDALRRAEQAATTPAHREHVTLVMKEHPQQFRIVTWKAPTPTPPAACSVTVDTPADLAKVRALCAGNESECLRWRGSDIVRRLEAVQRAVEVLAPLEQSGWGGDSAMSLEAAERLVQLKLARDGSSLVLTGSPDGEGAAILRLLSFDSEIYGWPMAELVAFTDPSDEILDEVIAEARRRGISHLHYRVPTEDVIHRRQAQRRGFQVMTTFLGLRWAVSVHAVAPAHDDVLVTSARPQDAPMLDTITAEAFAAGTRFHADPNLPVEGTRRLHLRWIANCLNGSAADVVRVARAAGRPVGYVTMRREDALSEALGCEIGSIGLLAVARGWRGRGIGTVLLGTAKRWAIERGLAQLEVGTEATNIAALTLYEANGFQRVQAKYSLHLTLRLAADRSTVMPVRELEQSPHALIGSRISLRPLTEADVTVRYLGWLNDATVTRYLEVGKRPMTLDDIRAYLERFRESTTHRIFAIVENATCRHIGNVTLNNINRQTGTADTGLMIGEKDCWGKGYATEAWSLLCAYAFSRLELRQIIAGAVVDNLPSIKTLEKLGFQPEMRQSRLVGGAVWETVRFSLRQERFQPVSVADGVGV